MGEIDQFASRAIRRSYASDKQSVEKFFRMLADAQARNPSGLPDKELQRVFDLHQAWLADHEHGLTHFSAGRPASGSQNIDGSHQLRLRLISAHRS